MRVGVDFGGTNLVAALVEQGGVRESASVPTRADAGPSGIMDDIAALVKSVADNPTSVGVGIPGEVDGDGRCVRLPNVAGFEGVAIASELATRIGCPVGVENDAIAAALGESLFGAGKDFKSFLLLTLGTGVGGGLVLDGSVRRGRGGFAGEVGHIPVDLTDHAPMCGCGNRGCMEAVAGTPAMLRDYHARSGESAVDIADLFQRADAVDEHALAVRGRMGWALGTAIAAIQNTLDLDGVVFCGGVANSLESLAPDIRCAMTERAFAPVLAEIPLVRSDLMPHTGVIGAAWLPSA